MRTVGKIKKNSTMQYDSEAIYKTMRLLDGLPDFA
jgi:hypothetical protein